MTIKRRFFSESLVVRLGISLGAIVALALTATISATIFAELSTGKAAAINLAGSLRMQTYWITVQVLRAHNADADALQNSINEFETRLRNAQLADRVPADYNDATRRAYERVATTWAEELKPAIERTAAAGPAAQGAFVNRMNSFVLDVDRLVYLLEHDLERRIQVLRVIQGIALFAIVIVMFIALYLLRSQVILPLADVLGCARRVRAGDFSARAEHTGADELGQLGQSFNFMVADLARSYATLEAKVTEKTEQLGRSNVSLEVLYNTTRTLAENALTQPTLDNVMRDIERVIGVRASAICAREEPNQRGFPIAIRSSAAAAGNLCEQDRCDECFGKDESPIHAIDGEADEHLISVPLAEGGNRYGVMLLQLAPGTELADWKMKLLESIGHHIGAALATAKRSDERRRIALMDERSVIARELHDSLAQSLSYLKIQVARLQSQAENKQGAAADIVAELKGGLNNAYRQLRELLTTFRLRMDGRGLADALQDTIREFSQRTGLSLHLHDHLLGHELDANEQIHVLQIVREALTNIEHHAQARRADIRLTFEQGRLVVTIDDDGIGIDESATPPHHYGLAIMHDRAATLGGTLQVVRRAEGGTHVEMRLAPRGRFQTAAAPEAA